MNSIETVKFYGDEIQAVREGEQVWVVVKRVCESLGIDESRQRKKLSERRWAVTDLMSATGPDGKNYDCFCLALDSVPMWLGGIAPARVKGEVRGKLEAYQCECARVLRDHFFGKPRMTADGMVPISTIGQFIEPLLERQNQHFLLLLRSMDDRHIEREVRLERRIEQRITDIENSGRAGTISPQTHNRIRAHIHKIADKEVLLKKWPSIRSATRDIYRELGEITGWGGKAQKWCDLPAQWESPVMVALTRRLIDAERHADRLIARQLDMFPKEEPKKDEPN